MASTTTIMITADIVRFVFLLFIFNIFTPFLSARQTRWKKLFINSERILYMKLPVLASLIIIGLIVTYNSKRYIRKKEENDQHILDIERDANNVRRKSLDNLDYIHIPLERLPVEALPEDDTVKECLETLRTLNTCRIVNLTGYTNTELKFQYGTANITPLTEYDQNYTLLVCTLQKWADHLMEAGLKDEAEKVLEFAMDTNTDVSRSYYMLAEIYASHGKEDHIRDLIKRAEGLKSLNSKGIVRTLQESYPYTG